MADSSRPWTEPSPGLAEAPALRPPKPRGAIADWIVLRLPLARQVGALAAVALTASWLGYYLITPLPFLDRETFRATVTLHLVTGTVFIPYFVYLLVARRLPGGSALDLPIAALLAVYLIATAASLNWRVSLEVTLVALMAAGVFYVLSDGGLLRRWQLETALMLAVLAAAAKAIWVVGDDYLDWLRLADAVRGGLAWGDLIPPTVPKVHDVGDHPNLLGGMMATALPFFLVAFLRSSSARLRVLVALAVAVLMLAMFLTVTRSAWLAAGAGAATTAALLLTYTPRGRALLRRFWPSTPGRQALVGLLALALAGVVVGVAVLAQSVETRPIWLFRESGTPRVDVMEAGAEMFQDYPMLGTGPGVYGLLYPEYSGKYANHAFHSHNGFLQSAVDLGVPGVLVMLALAGTLGWLLLRGLRDADGDRRLSIAASAGALVALGTFSLFDAPNGFKGPLVMLAAVGAIAVLSVREGKSAGSPNGPLHLGEAAQLAARGVIPFALAGLLITWGRLDIAHFYYSNGVSNANAERWSEAVRDAERAVEFDPQFAIYRLQLGAVQGEAYLATSDSALLGDAIAQLRRGLDLEPRSALGHANLALLLAEAGERGQQRTEALATLRFANSDPAVVLAAATALEKTGWDEEAVDAYAQAVSLDADLADSPFWKESPFRETRYWDIVGRSALVLRPCALLNLVAGDVPAGPLTRDEALTGCFQRVQSNPGEIAGRVVLAVAFIEDGRMDEARTLLDQVLDRQPDNGPARTALGSWFAAQENLDQAREQWLRAAQLDQTEALVLLGDSFPAGEVPHEVVDTLRSELRGAASQVQFHLTGILYYRFKFFRASPITMLLPGEWQDAVPARYAEAEAALARLTGK